MPDAADRFGRKDAGRPDLLSLPHSGLETPSLIARLPGIAARGTVYLAILAAVLPRGATTGPALSLYCALAGLAFLTGSFRLPDGKAGRVFQFMLAVAIVLCAYILFQSAQFEGNPFANPIWAEVGPLLGSEGGAVSVAPAVTRHALLTLMAPIAIYLAALALFSTDVLALRLLKVLGAFGAAFALFGILQLEFFPGHLLFSTKTAYLDSLTSVFVNRNTAGTMLGVASLLILCWILLEIAKTPSAQPLRMLLTAHAVPARRRKRIALLAACYAIVVLALFMTRSRGALLATLVAYLVACPLFWLDAIMRRIRGEPSPARAAAPRARTILLGIGIVVLVVLVFGGQSISRMEQKGVDVARLCTYLSTWRAFGDNWLFGTGFGTFQAVFPAFRDPTCGGIYGVWMRAHNVWLEGLLGLGIVIVPVLALVGGKLAQVLVIGFRTRRRMRPVPIAGLGIAVLVGVHGLLDFSLQIPGMAAYTAAALAAITTICLKRAR